MIRNFCEAAIAIPCVHTYLGSERHPTKKHSIANNNHVGITIIVKLGNRNTGTSVSVADVASAGVRGIEEDAVVANKQTVIYVNAYRDVQIEITVVVSIEPSESANAVSDFGAAIISVQKPLGRTRPHLVVRFGRPV